MFNNTNNKAEQGLIGMNIKDHNPVICDFCYSMLNSLNELSLQSQISDETGKNLFNIILMYARYFNVEIDNTKINKTGQSNNEIVNIVHLTHKGIRLCHNSLKNLYDLMIPLLKQNASIECLDIINNANSLTI